MLDKESIEKHGPYNHNLGCIEEATGIDRERMCYIIKSINELRGAETPSRFIEFLENLEMTKREMAALAETIYSNMVEAKEDVLKYNPSVAIMGFLSSMLKRDEK